MSAAKSCDCPCPDPVITEIPGVEGEPGLNGANGAAGINAFTFTTAAFTVPAIGGSVIVLVASSVWATIGQNIFILGAGYFTVTAKPGTTSLTLTYLDYAGNTFTGNVIAAGASVSPAGTQPALSAALPNDITDNSTGTPSDTISVGAGQSTLTIHRTFLTGVAAGDVVTNMVLGYAFEILSWSFVNNVVSVGAGASRVYNMEIGAVDVGTVPSTLTLTEAGTDTVGEVTDGTAVAGANVGSATDTFTIECAAGGTAFTSGNGFFLIRIKNLDSANAWASVAKHIDDLIVALT